MTLLDVMLERGAPGGWGQLLGPGEEDGVLRLFGRELEGMLRKHGVEPTPLLAIRVEDVVASWLTARRLEDALCEDGASGLDEARTARGAAAAPGGLVRAPHPLLEAAGKARERLRKALKELEDACTAGRGDEKLGAAGLAEEVRPLLRLGDGVLDDALAFEARKARRAGAAAGEPA